MKPRHRPDSVRAEIVAALRDAGAFVVDQDSSVPGVPDLAVLWVGETTWIELKSPKGKLSPEQRAWHDSAARAGVRVYVAKTPREALKAVGVLGQKAQERDDALHKMAGAWKPVQASATTVKINARALRPSVKRYGT